MEGRSPRIFLRAVVLVSASSGWLNSAACRSCFLILNFCPDALSETDGIERGRMSIGASLSRIMEESVFVSVVSLALIAAIWGLSIKEGVSGADNESTGSTTWTLSSAGVMATGPFCPGMDSVSLCSRSGVTIRAIKARSASQYRFNSFCSTCLALKRLDEDDFSPICSSAPISLCESPSRTDRRNTFPYCSGRRSISATKSSYGGTGYMVSSGTSSMSMSSSGCVKCWLSLR